MTTADFWNDLAEHYAAQPVGDPDAFDRKIALTKARMSPDSVVLDIGCGTGSLALRLASSGGYIHGLDFSREMIRIAEDKTRKQGVENARFHCGPFDDSFTTFEDESLDGICAYSLIHLMEDRPAALRRVFELLKPGGFFISSTLCLAESWKPYGMILRVMRLLGKAPYVGVFDKAMLIREIQEAGFIDVNMPDVGAENTVAFVVCHKPSPDRGAI